MSTTTILVGGAFFVLAIVLVALGALLYTAHRDADLERWRAKRAGEEAARNTQELAAATGELEGLRNLRDALQAALEGAHTQGGARIRELERELAALRAGPLVGRLILVNTPEPDGQSIRGVCTLELEDGGVVLQPATYLDTVRTRGNELEVVERPMMAAVVPRYAWAQLLEADGTPGERIEPPPEEEV